MIKCPAHSLTWTHLPTPTQEQHTKSFLNILQVLVGFSDMRTCGGLGCSWVFLKWATKIHLSWFAWFYRVLWVKLNSAPPLHIKNALLPIHNFFSYNEDDRPNIRIAYYATHGPRANNTLQYPSSSCLAQPLESTPLKLPSSSSGTNTPQTA